MKHMIFTEQQARPIESGDAGIVFTKEGGFYIFAVDPPSANPAEFSEVQADQAIMLDAFKTALTIPGVVAMLVKMANDPSVRRRVDLLERHERAAAH